MADQKQIITEAANRYGIRPDILWGLYGGGTSPSKNVSRRADAEGPFRFEPATARSLGVNPHDFKSAAFGAAKYLGEFKGRGVSGMLSAYNAGPAGGYQSGYVSTTLKNAQSYGSAPSLAVPEGGTQQRFKAMPGTPTRQELNPIPKTTQPRDGKTRVPPAERLGQELALLVASGKIRSAATFRADVRKRIAALKEVIAHPERYEGGASHAEGARANLELLQGAEHPHVLHNTKRIVDNGIRYGRELNKGERQLKGVAAHPQAALSEYALVHMGSHPLTDDAIKAHAARSGRTPETLAHVPHAVDAVHRLVSHRSLPRIAKEG